MIMMGLIHSISESFVLPIKKKDGSLTSITTELSSLCLKGS